MASRFAKQFFASAILAVGLTAAGAVAAADAPTTFRVSETVRTRADVASVDHAERKVTLKLPDGAPRSFRAGPEVKNFDQVKAGDVVDVLHTMVGELELKRPTSDTPDFLMEDVSETAPAGWKPAGFAAIKTSAIVKITTIKPETGEVAFVGPLGNVFQVTVDDQGFRKTMQDFKPGDLAQASYVEALSIVVAPKP